MAIESRVPYLSNKRETAEPLVTSPEGLAIWLHPEANLELMPGARYRLPDGSIGEVRVLKPGSHLRITWQPPGWEKASTIQVRVIPNGARTVIAFHQEHLPDAASREERRRHFAEALDRMAELFEHLNK